MTNPTEALDSPSPSRSSSPTKIQRETPIVLVVEDEPAPMKMIEASLSARNYQVVTATTGARALDLVAVDEPDVMIVDLGLPDIDGLDLCRHLRLWTKSPIIVVTADGSEERMVQALDEGADDYVIKPFSMPELLSRIGVAIRHRNMLDAESDELIVVVGALSVDVRAHEARVHDAALDLPPRQFKLLTMLARNPDRILTYHHLVQHLWDSDNETDVSHALRILVSKLRKSLGEGEDIPRIVTEPYIGYRLVVDHRHA
jgi:two-component system KDP operon response regulator KdpE